MRLIGASSGAATPTTTTGRAALLPNQKSAMGIWLITLTPPG